MSYFEKADSVDATKVSNEFLGRFAQVTNELVITRIQLQQHIDRENELMEIIKDTYPDLYQELIKKEGENNGK